MTKLAPEEMAVLGIGGAFIFATLFPKFTAEDKWPAVLGWILGTIMLLVVIVVIIFNR